ncbi:hypothetical protein DB35_23765 [Streptomyces abyssalis]|uniref:Uncharacterized protein n=1 Tax=Streptomyces abyssalis TaxID=933944 RepID=A0A1E7JNR1_9ACTN|nr:hypothetical protein DB35_23765 [Streptomyces abyssalis]OEU89927.1 hypothetical protein AN215_09770 [Streptomyces abyssalis]
MATGGHDASKRVDETELLEIARDPVDARRLRESLEKLAGGASNDTLKEMAKEVLAGRIGLRDAVAVPAYSEALIEGGRPFREEWDKLSAAERERLAAEGEREYEAKRLEMEAEQRRGAENSGSKARHSGRGWSVY